MKVLITLLVLMALAFSSLGLAQSMPIPNNKAIKQRIAAQLKIYREDLGKHPKVGIDYWLPDAKTLIVKFPYKKGQTVYVYSDISTNVPDERGRDIFDDHGLISGHQRLDRTRTKYCSRMKDGSYHVSVSRTDMVLSGGHYGGIISWDETSIYGSSWPRDRLKHPHP